MHEAKYIDTADVRDVNTRRARTAGMGRPTGDIYLYGRRVEAKLRLNRKGRCTVYKGKTHLKDEYMRSTSDFCGYHGPWGLEIRRSFFVSGMRSLGSILAMRVQEKREGKQGEDGSEEAE